jgi:NADPH-dependent ferric siderophore reductase
MNDIARPDELVTRIQGVRRYTLEVVDTMMVTPRMRRIRLGSPELWRFEYQPGQDVMLWVPAEEGRMLYRRYTIRHLDRAGGLLDIDVFEHGKDGPGEHWVKTAQPGDQVVVVGPRGKISLVDAPWHVFVGDETYIPATFAMLEALPAGTQAWALLEVADSEEEQPLSVGADVRLTWVHRSGLPTGDPAALVAAVGAVELPTSAGHVYVGAELQVARAVSRAFEARGFESARISSKAYWGRGRANAGIGEPKENDEGK